MSRVKSSDGMAFLASGDVFLILWQQPSREHRVRWAFDQMDAALAAQSGSMIGMQLVLPTSSPPDGPARAETYARMRLVGGRIRRLVTVPLGDALWVSLVRTIMRGLMLVTGQSKVQFVADDEEQGLDTLLQAASATTPSRRFLVAGFDEMRTTLGAPRAMRSQPASPSAPT
jgi:hypothetical protein